jgi:serine/threonine-protein kinase
MRCPSCTSEIAEDARYCGSCGAVCDATDTPTVAMGTEASLSVASSSTAGVDAGRFVPGTLLAQRYRIVGLLGRGGMGEVYRATDLVLGQTVALKFLPEAAARDANAMARFHGEVRIARQVSHPNVCRVYDIGEVQGQTYLSMEYVDGEDLSSLLRRIGNVPCAKGVEIARKLCAGLAAAHEKGVIHRDLKPSNVMIDGRGQVLITDFGLAGLVNRIDGAEVRSGTPQYMAPEQLAGTEVTPLSDIYSLGLVLYEMFTGRRPFEAGSLAELVKLHEESAPATPSSLVRDLDPAVESIILRCLDPDPRHRPPSALSVAAALPGGDPLAAALAAGETPSPNLVAASGQTEGPPVPLAVGLALIVAAGLALAGFLNFKLSILGKTPMEHSPAVLAQKARDLAASFGYAERPGDAAYGLREEEHSRRWLNTHTGDWDYQRTGRPAVVEFWYRESSGELTPEIFSSSGEVTLANPPPVREGMLSMLLDPQARLLELQAMPPEREPPVSGTIPSFDWTKLFQAAELDMSRFQAAPPEWAPLGHFDDRAAWTGTYAGHAPGPVRVEAASWRGKPVYFKIVEPWTEPSRQAAHGHEEQRTREIFSLCLFLCVLIGGLLLARRNLKHGRGDRRGAARASTFIFVLGMLAFVLTAGHVPSHSELPLLIMGVGLNLFNASMFWTVYIAMEPFVRRRWPHAIVSWTRLLAGRIHDPLVGRDLLIGCAVGVFSVILEQVSEMVQRNALPQAELDTLQGFGHLAANYLSDFGSSIMTAFGIFLVIFLMRLLFRKEWIAAALFVVIFAGSSASAGTRPWLAFAFAAAVLALLVFALLRFGLVTMAIAVFLSNSLPFIPLTIDLSHWAVFPGFVPFFLLAALTAFGFHSALAGRRLIRDDLLT